MVQADRALDEDGKQELRRERHLTDHVGRGVVDDDLARHDLAGHANNALDVLVREGVDHVGREGRAVEDHVTHAVAASVEDLLGAVLGRRIDDEDLHVVVVRRRHDLRDRNVGDLALDPAHDGVADLDQVDPLGLVAALAVDLDLDADAAEDLDGRADRLLAPAEVEHPLGDHLLIEIADLEDGEDLDEEVHDRHLLRRRVADVLEEGDQVHLVGAGGRESLVAHDPRADARHETRDTAPHLSGEGHAVRVSSPAHVPRHDPSVNGAVGVVRAADVVVRHVKLFFPDPGMLDPKASQPFL